MLKAILLLLFVGLFASCVTNQKIQYLQYDDVNSDEVLLDSAVRKYENTKYVYRIQPDDILSVRVESLDKLEYNFFSRDLAAANVTNINQNNFAVIGELVDEFGDIEFPVVGKIKIAGLTVFEAQETIKRSANLYLKDPVVKVRMLNFRFTVLGEVRREGSVNSYNNRVTVMEALGLTGGLSDLADRSRVKLIRQTGNQMEVVYINLLDEELIASPYYYMHQNDVIVVPPLKQRPFRNYFGQNFGILISSISTALLVVNLLRR